MATGYMNWKITAKELGVYGFVYLIVNTLNDKKYIGVTTTSVYKRWCSHISNSKELIQTMKLARAILKYGKDVFRVVCLGTATSKQELETLEKEAIAFYKSSSAEGGYNVSLGGFTNGKHSEFTKQKISKSKKALNYKLSDAHKAAISNANKKPKSLEHAQKVAIANKGKKRSAEFCIKHKQSQQKMLGKALIAISPSNQEFSFSCIREASRQLNLVSRHLISKVLKGTYRQYKGWRFKYASME